MTDSNPSDFHLSIQRAEQRWMRPYHAAPIGLALGPFRLFYHADPIGFPIEHLLPAQLTSPLGFLHRDHSKKIGPVGAVCYLPSWLATYKTHKHHIKWNTKKRTAIIAQCGYVVCPSLSQSELSVPNKSIVSEKLLIVCVPPDRPNGFSLLQI